MLMVGWQGALLSFGGHTAATTSLLYGCQTRNKEKMAKWDYFSGLPPHISLAKASHLIGLSYEEGQGVHDLTEFPKRGKKVLVSMPRDDLMCSGCRGNTERRATPSQVGRVSSHFTEEQIERKQSLLTSQQADGPPDTGSSSQTIRWHEKKHI